MTPARPRKARSVAARSRSVTRRARGLRWTAEEYAVIDSLIELNWNDERASYHAWQQAFYQEAGAPIPIGVGLAVGAAIKAEAAAADTVFAA